MDEHVVPLLDEASIAYKIDIVPYDTNVSSVGEIMVEKSTLIDDAVAVVLASSSKGRVREFFIGSVCNYCLHRCKKPVIVYKPSEADEKAEEERVQTTQKAASSDDKEKAKDK
jgi:nucleotide-binding universal stress UspA family protein